jgi:hypothetical protein
MLYKKQSYNKKTIKTKMQEFLKNNRIESIVFYNCYYILLKAENNFKKIAIQLLERLS